MIPLYLVSSFFYVIHNILSVIYTSLLVIYNNRHTELSTIVDNLWITPQQADTQYAVINEKSLKESLFLPVYQHSEMIYAHKNAALRTQEFLFIAHTKSLFTSYPHSCG